MRFLYQLISKRFNSHFLLPNKIISATNIHKVRQGRSILEGISFDLGASDKMMLLGENGSGKSTLAQIISGKIKPDVGTIKYLPNINIQYLPQNINTIALENGINTVGEYILHISPAVKIDFHELSTQSRPTIISLHQSFKDRHEENINSLLYELNVEHISLNRAFDSLSGGEKCRVTLASLLLTEPDLLILDEPTNHLDAAGKNWLYAYLKNYKNALIMITHDPSLMNLAGNIMARLDAATKTINFFHGSYTHYLQQIKLKQDKEQLLFEVESKKENLLKLEIEKMQKKRSKTDRYVINDVNKVNRLQKELTQRQEQYDEVPIQQYQKPNFSFPTLTEKIDQPLLSFNGITKSYANKAILKNCSASVKKGDKIALLGGNGAGKSVLMKIIAQTILPDAGTIHHHQKSKIGYMSQDPESVLDNTSKNILETFSAEANCSKQQAISILKSCCLLKYDELNRHYSNLSFGLQRKLQLAKIIIAHPNILLLDEPTNHLDAYSLEALEDALLNFNGAIIAVSHDQRFINKFANQSWLLHEGQLQLTESKPSKKLKCQT